ncbi:hypothetical protein [Vibrio sp. CAU 1672]|uniref:hypothetical protein n=1 Tax=Vibrio sp. CAU 1672 TaxID=3032594 RepID=UPI0023D9F0FB|nr:hypothetical protein [Vibrio sp. CAU 1672]MDF2154559.1 hypothetical protein [Vibrio sp. CAU 1672]
MKKTNNTCWYSKDFSCTSLFNPNIFKQLAWLLVISVALAIPSVQGAAGEPSDQGVQPIEYDGNPTCSDLLGIPDLKELKVEPVADGIYSDGELEVTVAVQEGAKTFSWDQGSSPIIMQGVFVKGGPNGNLYEYYSDGLLVNSDGGLHAPVGKNGSYYGLSHISFCYTPGKPEIKITKTCEFGEIVNGNALKYNYSLKVENTGQLPLYDIKATDITALDIEPGGDHEFELDMLAVGGYETFLGSFTVGQNGIQNFAKVTAALEAFGAVVVDDTDDYFCPSQEIPGTLSLQKECNVVVVNRLDAYGLQVNYEGSVCNTSDVIINNVIVQDSKDPDLIFVGTLYPQNTEGDCFDFAGSYEPVPQEGEGLPLPGEAVNAFEDQVTATGITAFGFPVAGDEYVTPAGASCTLCPTCPEPVICPE